MNPEGYEMVYPASMDSYPIHIREVFQFMQQAISADELIDL